MTPKFVVFNQKDIEQYLSEENQALLNSFVDTISKSREIEGKLKNDYYVCNQDEPYAHIVIRSIIEGEIKKRGGY